MTTVTIRMYNVGFGDCFLVTYPGPIRTHRILIDCGMHLSGQGPFKLKAVVAGIVADITDPDGVPRLDAVVASHRHFDHIAGFDDKAWAAVAVAEVWLPWTEDPTDLEAKRIHDKQAKAAAALRAHLAARAGVANGDEAKENRIAAMLLDNTFASNSGASKTLMTGFRNLSRKRFLPTTTDPESFTSTFLPETTVHVLGPSRDQAVIQDMDPPKVQSFLELAGETEPSDTDDDGQPRLRPFKGLPVPKDPVTEKRIKAVHLSLRRSAVEFAVALEDAVNGTSLVLAIEIGSLVLLFTGDAQWGTWRSAMDVPEWGGLLKRATFLKVGHHGSHNASPVTLINDFIPDGIPAMISVSPVADWPEIPRQPLLDELTAKGIKWIRSDLHPAGAPFDVDPSGRFVDLVLTG
jgi:beta-lactamase superfamily II metal-dependent hydrolase